MTVPKSNNSALVDQTNSGHTSRPGSPTAESIHDEAYIGKSLRRAKPLRRPQFSIDSDDTLSSEHWSIYNAENVLSEENVIIKDDMESGLDWHPTPTNIPLSPSLENLSQAAEQQIQSCEPANETAITSHSGWSATQLEPIIEQRSPSSLRRSSSLSRIRSRPAKPLATIASEHNSPEEWPSDSQRPRYWPWSGLHRCDSDYVRRSFSENDLACMPLPAVRKKDQKDIDSVNSSDSSTTSQEIRRRLSLCPAFPHRPHRPPLDRAPTPPGIPSFGTPEAIALLTPQPQPPRESAQHSLRRSQQNLSNAARQSGIAESQSLELRPSASGVSHRRSIWNWLRLGSPPSSESTTVSEPRNASLPAGFVPRAGDGTLVRGIFSARGSGHGVGSRPQGVRGIESHPFHSRMSNIAEIIQEIDKACEAAGSEPVHDEPLRPLQHRLRGSMRPDQDVDMQQWELSPNSHPDNQQLGDVSRVNRDQARGSELSGTGTIASPASIICPDGVPSGATSTRAIINPRRVVSPDSVSNPRVTASPNARIIPSAPPSKCAIISAGRITSPDPTTSSTRAIVSPRDPRSPTFSMASPIFSPPFSPQPRGQDLPDLISGQNLTQRHEADIEHFMSESQRYMAERQREEERYREETSTWTRFWHACCLACCEIDVKDRRKRDYHEQQLVVEEQPGGWGLRRMRYGRGRVF